MEAATLWCRVGGQRGTAHSCDLQVHPQVFPVVSRRQSFSDRPSPNRACSFHCTRLASRQHCTCENQIGVQFQASHLPTFLSVSRCHLPPFVLSEPLPRVFGDSGGSLAMRLASCRRSRIEAHQRESVCRLLVRFLTPFIPGYSPQRAFPTLPVTYCALAVSSRELCCDGCSLTPLETKLQPIQV
jgi:hypothetical protein